MNRGEPSQETPSSDSPSHYFPLAASPLPLAGGIRLNKHHLHHLHPPPLPPLSLPFHQLQSLWSPQVSSYPLQTPSSSIQILHSLHSWLLKTNSSKNPIPPISLCLLAGNTWWECETVDGRIFHWMNKLPLGLHLVISGQTTWLFLRWQTSGQEK